VSPKLRVALAIGETICTPREYPTASASTVMLLEAVSVRA